MGKYAMSSVSSRSRKRDRQLTGYSGFSPDAYNHLMYHASDFNIFGISPVKMYYNDKYMTDYLNNRGLTWADMLYPGIAKGSGRWNVDTKTLKKLYE